MKRTSTIHGFFETAARDPDRVAVNQRFAREIEELFG